MSPLRMSFLEVEKPLSFLKKYIDKLNNHEYIRGTLDLEGNDSPNRIGGMKMWHAQRLLMCLKLSQKK
jgi:hypothetical protein